MVGLFTVLEALDPRKADWLAMLAVVETSEDEKILSQEYPKKRWSFEDAVESGDGG